MRVQELQLIYIAEVATQNTLARIESVFTFKLGYFARLKEKEYSFRYRA